MTDRLPPHSPESERALLGACLLDPQSSLAESASRVRSPEAFYEIRNRNVWEALLALQEAGKTPDVISVAQLLSDSGKLPADGWSFVAGLPDTCASRYELPNYIETVLEKWVRRKAIAGCLSGIEHAHDNKPLPEVLDAIEKTVLEAGNDLAGESDQSMGELVKEQLAFFEQCHGSNGKIIGLSTGFYDLDKMTSGLKGGDMFVLAGRPSTGKTSLAMNIAERAALDNGVPVGVFSLEMTKASLTRRLMCSRAKVNERTLLQGVASEADIAKMSVASSAYHRANNIHIDDTANMPILQLRARARRMHQRHKIGLLVIDYLQLLKSVTGRNSNRVDELTGVSNGIKALAKELDIPVIVLAQLNREIEKDGCRKPRLSDLRECGAIEQDADIVGMLYRPEENPDPTALVIPVNLCINKQRNGPIGDVELTFFKEYTRFESRSKFDDNH
jgi:replicative DNA helicase